MTWRREFATTVVIDDETSEVLIDGTRVPYWLGLPGPTVERYGDDEVGVHVLHLPILIDGVIILKGDAHRVIDPILGDVGDWAARYVHDALVAKLPWLTA